MRPAPSILRVAVVLGLATLVLAGCRQGSALHGRYNNFRAYYNAYYNASRVMEEGERQLERPDQVIDRTRLLSLYPTAGGRGANFQEAIDKSGELLRNRADSKWADDALFVIGKAYYYQNNLVGAEQKFRETIELASARGNDRLADEARVWLGRTLGAAQRYEEGTSVLQERLTAAEGDRGALARLRLVLGELYAREGRYQEAAEALREGIEDERDSDFAARALLLLGQVEEAAGQYDAAADAYRDAVDRRPPYELAYAAQLNRALVIGLDAGRTDEAIDLIRRMRRDDKNYDHRAEVELAYGRILAASGEERDAVEAMRSVLYDPQLAGGPLRGEAHARLAEFYRDIRSDYVRASAHFDTAATSIRIVPAPSESPTRAALLDVRRTADAYLAFATVAGRLAEADSLLELGMLDDAAFAARIEAIEAQRLADYREEQRLLQQTRAQQAFSGEGSGIRPPTASGDPLAATPARGNNLAVGGRPGAAGRPQSGFLSYQDPASVQANAVSFERVWGDRPLVPNWRRRAAIEASANTTDIGDGLTPGELARQRRGDGPPPLDLTPVPRTPLAQTQLRTQRAALRYEAANSLFLSLARPDSAATLYRLALEDGPAPEIALRIRFALAEVLTDEAERAEAESLYREIIDGAPESELAAAARARLGMAPLEVEEVETEPASFAYEQARERWREGAYATAVSDLLALAADSSRADQAPRALLGAASAYIEWAQRDGFDPLRPLPESVIPTGLFPEPAPEASGDLEVPTEAIEDPQDTENPEDVEPLDREEPLGDDEALEEGDQDLELTEIPEDVLRDVSLPVGEDADEVPIQASGEPDDDPIRTRRLGDPPSAVPGLATPDVPVAARPETEASGEGAGPREPTVDDVLALVQERGPGTPFAQRAAALRVALAPEPEAPEAAPTTLGGAYGFEGDEPLDPAYGGFTWRAQRIPNPLAVLVLLNGYERRGIRAAAIADGDGYRVVIGQFETRPDAFAVREDLPTEVQGAGASVVPMEGLELLGPEDLQADE